MGINKQARGAFLQGFYAAVLEKEADIEGAAEGAVGGGLGGGLGGAAAGAGLLGLTALLARRRMAGMLPGLKGAVGEATAAHGAISPMRTAGKGALTLGGIGAGLGGLTGGLTAGLPGAAALAMSGGVAGAARGGLLGLGHGLEEQALAAQKMEQAQAALSGMEGLHGAVNPGRLARHGALGGGLLGAGLGMPLGGILGGSGGRPKREEQEMGGNYEDMQQEGGMPPGAGGPEGPMHPGQEVPPEVVVEAMHSMFHDPNTPPDQCDQCAMISQINEGAGMQPQGPPPAAAGPPPPPPAGPPPPPPAAAGPPPKQASVTAQLIGSLIKSGSENNAYRHPSAATQLFGNPQMTMKQAFAMLKDPNFSSVHGGFSTEYENDVLAGSGVASAPSNRR